MPIIKFNAGLYEREPNVLDIDISDATPNISAGDLLMLWEAVDNSITSQTITDNLAFVWNKVIGGSGNGGGHVLYWKIAAGGETTLTSSTNNDAIYSLIGVQSGTFNAGSPIDVFNGSNATNGLENLANQVTTTEDNTLIFKSLGIDGNRQPTYFGQGTRVFQGTGEAVITTCMSVYYYNQASAGLTSGGNWVNNSADGGGKLTVSIRDADPVNPSVTAHSATGHLSEGILLNNFTNPIAFFNEPVLRAQQADRSFDAAADVAPNNITIVGHGFTEAQIVQYEADGGTEIGGLTSGTQYYVNVNSVDTFELRTFTGQNRFDQSSDIPMVAGTGAQRFVDISRTGDTGDDDEVDFNRNVSYQRNSQLSERVFANGGQDFSGKSVGFYFDVNSRTETGPIDLNGTSVYLRDSSNNYRLWTIAGIDLEPVGQSSYTLAVLDVDDTNGKALKTEGAFDSSDVVAYGCALMSNAAANSAEYRTEKYEFGTYEGVTLVGGSPLYPAVFETAIESENGRRASLVQGAGQFLLSGLIKIGDGSTPTYFDGFGSVEFFPSYNTANKTTTLDIAESGFLVNLGNANDAFILSYAASSFGPFTFEIAAASNPSATYNFNGQIFTPCDKFILQNFIVSSGCQLIECTGIDLNGANLTSYSFNNCEKVLQDGATFNSCTFQNATNNALELTDSTKLVGGSFNNNNIGIEVTTAGSIELDALSFSGNGVDLDFSGAGVLNINLINGSDVPTTSTSGGGTINVTQSVEVTAPNLIDGTRVQLYNETKDSELDNSLVSGGSGYVFNANLADASVDDGDTLRIRATYQSGVTAKSEVEATGVITTSGLSYLISQVDNTPYNTIGIDGSTITKFTADYVNDEVDIIVGMDFTLAEFYAWWVFNETTSQGIAEFFGGIDAVDEANFNIKNAIVNIFFDNSTATNVSQTDNRRLYRDDLVRPVVANTSGGGGIDIEWRSPVTIANSDGIQTDLTNIYADTQRVDGLIEDDGGDQFTTKALSQAPGGGGGSDVNIISIDGDATSAVNLKNMYNGTGYLDPNGPAYQAQVSNIAITGSAINAAYDTMVTTVGTVDAGTPDDTIARDGIYYQISDDTGAMEIDIDFQIGTDGVPTGLTLFGRLNGSNDSLQIQVYDWVDMSYRVMDTWQGINGSLDLELNIPLFTSMVGTGVDKGIVRVKLFNGGTLTNATLYLDQIITSYAVVNRSVGYQGGAVWTDTSSTNTGAAPFIDGVADNPVNNYANALTVADALSLRRYTFAPNDVIVTTRDHDTDQFIGSNATVVIGGFRAPSQCFECVVLGSTAENPNTPHLLKECVSGLIGSALTLNEDCIMLACAVVNVVLSNVAASAINLEMADCSGNTVLNMNGADIDFTSTAGTNHTISTARWAGPIHLINMTPGDTAFIEGTGDIIIDASCTGGLIEIAGIFNLFDNAGGAVAVEEDTKLSNSKIDETLSVSHDPGSWGPADVSGLATEANATANKNEVIAEVDENEAKIDSVQATVNAIPNNPLLTNDARLDNLDATISSRSTFNPITDAVANVTTVQTTVSNDDMRGTDGANTVTPPTVGQIDTELTNNHGLGSWTTGSGGTTPAAVWSYVDRQLTQGTKDSEIDAIKSKTDNLNFTGNDVQSVASNMRGTDGANTVTPSTPADIASQTTDLKGADNRDLTEVYDKAGPADLSGVATRDNQQALRNNIEKSSKIIPAKDSLPDS